MNSVAEIRHHIRAIEDTAKITRAMHLIASAKMRRAMYMHDQNLIFFNQVRSGIRFILDTAGGTINNRFFREHGKNAAYLVVAGDKGLCGGYNQQVLKFALGTMQNSGHARIRLYTVGHIASDFFFRSGMRPDVHFQHVCQNPTLRNARRITSELIELFLTKQVDEVYAVYTMLGEGGFMRPTALRLMPLIAADFADTAPIHEKVAGGFAFHPSPAAVAEAMAHDYLMGLVYSVLAQSFASENRARMAAMNSATRSAGEMLDKLRLQLNHVRQGAITQEISEILAGSEQEGQT
jgi:F-type H+-transporting ATPase subunit gamma